jgi:hypothetical protein
MAGNRWSVCDKETKRQCTECKLGFAIGDKYLEFLHTWFRGKPQFRWIHQGCFNRHTDKNIDWEQHIAKTLAKHDFENGIVRSPDYFKDLHPAFKEAYDNVKREIDRTHSGSGQPLRGHAEDTEANDRHGVQRPDNEGDETV